MSSPKGRTDVSLSSHACGEILSSRSVELLLAGSLARTGGIDVGAMNDAIFMGHKTEAVSLLALGLRFGSVRTLV